mgnify:CR=1 FL=1
MEFIGGRSHRRAAWTHIRERENEGRTEDGGVVCGIGAVTTETSQLTAQPSGDGARRRKENRGTRGDRQDDRLRARKTPTEKMKGAREDGNRRGSEAILSHIVTKRKSQ